jgi:DNA-directed RNA polymerase subunit RPC12/RpoP
MQRLPIRECAWCGRQFAPVRVDQRFDCRECLDKYFVEERKRALAAWRAQQRGSLFLTPMHAEVGTRKRTTNPLRGERDVRQRNRSEL